MSQVHSLLEELAGIGATVRPAGDQLILRAGPRAIPADLVRRIKEAKADLVIALASRNGREFRIVEWLNEHPHPSRPGRCAWCQQSETPAAVVLPFGTEPDTHVWLHAECWSAWTRARYEEAARALTALRDDDAARG